MPHYTSDRCTGCGNLTSPERLTIKRVSFSKRVTPQKLHRSRTIAWLCDTCLEGDEHYNLPAHKGAPGMRSEALERVRSGEV